jgi:hypothetical protein
VPAADVEQAADRREVVSVGDRLARQSAVAAHRGLKDLEALGVALHPAEAVGAEDRIERGLARAHAMVEPAPRRPSRDVAEPARHRPERTLHVGSEALGELAVAEDLPRLFDEHLDRREGAQHAIQRVGVRAGARRQLVERERALAEQVGDAELGGVVERARDELPQQELIEPLCGGGEGSSIPCAGVRVRHDPLLALQIALQRCIPLQ